MTSRPEGGGYQGFCNGNTGLSTEQHDDKEGGVENFKENVTPFIDDSLAVIRVHLELNIFMNIFFLKQVSFFDLLK